MSLSLPLKSIVLRSSLSDIKQVPFGRPQEQGTIDNDSNFLTDFIIFLIRTAKKPIPGFKVIVHPLTRKLLIDLHAKAGTTGIAIEPVTNLLHHCVWSFLSNPTDEFKQNQLMCPLTRFLICWALTDQDGTFCQIRSVPPAIAKVQWSFRATGCAQIFRRRHVYGGNCFE